MVQTVQIHSSSITTAMYVHVCTKYKITFVQSCSCSKLIRQE